MAKKITPEELIDIFKKNCRSEEIQLDNLDMAYLTFDDNENVVVENEHGTQFPVSDLSNDEMLAFKYTIISL